MHSFKHQVPVSVRLDSLYLHIVPSPQREASSV